MTFFTILAGLFGMAATVLWLVIGWRAMKAHESLAESMALLHREVRRTGDHLTGEDKRKQGWPKLGD